MDKFLHTELVSVAYSVANGKPYWQNSIANLLIGMVRFRQCRKLLPINLIVPNIYCLLFCVSANHGLQKLLGFIMYNYNY